MKPLRGWTRPPWAAGLSAVVFTILVSRSAESDWVRDGAPISPSDSAQSIPLIVSDGDGGSADWPPDGVVVSGVYGGVEEARHDPAPTEPLGQGPGDMWPSVALDGSGGVLVAWSYFTRSAYDVHVLRLDATGTRTPG